VIVPPLSCSVRVDDIGNYLETRSERNNGPEDMSDDSQVDVVKIIWKRGRIRAENLAVISISDAYLRNIVCRSLLASLNVGAIPGVTFRQRRHLNR